MIINLIINYLKKKLLYVVICFLFILIYLGLLVIKIDTKSFFKKPVCDHCNVILISLDTLAANNLPCYGYERNTAPNLCNFAKNNVLFTNMFSNAGWTLPSHFSIFTSLYPNHHNMTDDDNSALSPNINMMAELFKKANYKTIYVGPMTNSSLPISRGIGRGFDITLNGVSSKSLTGWDKGISQLIKNNHKNQYTFLFLHTYWVHYPYVVNEASEYNKRMFTNDFYQDVPLDLTSYTKFSKEFLDFVINMYENKIKEGVLTDLDKNKKIVDNLKGAKNLADAEKIYNSLITDIATKRSNFSEFYFNKIGESSEKVSYSKALYDEMIFYLDKKLTMIFDLVSNSKLANNTIIIITSDHGESFIEHGSLGHPADSLYNETTKVLLTMYIPGIKQRKIDNLVQSIDILPTILNLTGLGSSKNNFDGIDLTDFILGRQNTKQNDYLISEGPGIDSIRDNQWKLYVRTSKQDKNSKYELYDLKNDPLEKINLAQKQPGIVEKLHDSLKRIIYKR